MRGLRPAVSAASALALAALLVAPAGAQETSALGGYRVGGNAIPIQITLDAPTVAIPTDHTLELDLARTDADIDSGPSAHGLASLMWPGALFANGAPILKSELERQGFPPGILPELPVYPVRAETFYPKGPDRRESGAAGSFMRSRADEGVAEAQAAISSTDLPTIVSAGEATSSMHSVVIGGAAVAEGRASVESLSLFDGVITVDSLTSVATVASDGVKPQFSGGITVSGLRIRDQEGEEHSFTIDEKGLQAFGQDGGDPAGDVNEALSSLREQGLAITLVSSTDDVRGVSGRRTIGGLVVTARSEKADPLIESLPPELRDQLRARGVGFDQVLVIRIGGVTAFAAASPAFIFEIPEIPPPPQIIVQQVPVPQIIVQQVPVIRRVAVAVAPRVLGTKVLTPVAVVGVPAGLAIVILLAAVVASRGLRRFALLATSGERGGAGCPLEEGARRE